MEKENIEENHLVAILVAKGYTEESAIKCVQDVLIARREAREEKLKQYKEKRVRADFGGIFFEVLVHDVKIDMDGKTQFQVKPLNGGNKMVWVKHITN